MPYTLVAIGFLSGYRVYINVSRTDAIARWNAEHPDTLVTNGEDLPRVKEITVDGDEFEVYDLWEA